MNVNGRLGTCICGNDNSNDIENNTEMMIWINLFGDEENCLSFKNM